MEYSRKVMEKLTNKRIAELVRADDYSPMKLVSLETEPRLDAPGQDRNYRPDFLLEIEWEGETFKFIAEAKTVSTPKTMEQAILQVTTYTEALNEKVKGGQYYPLIIIPYLSEAKANMLMKRAISGLGLSGNRLFYVPGKLLVFRSKAEKNKYPSNAPIKNVYRMSSSIVARAMILRPQFTTVNEVLEEIESRGGKLSLGTVSKVLKALEDDLLISRSPGIRLIDGRSLLEKLRENYRPPTPLRRMQAKVSDLPLTIAKISENANENDISWAINEPNKYTVFPSAGVPTQIYTEDIAGLLSKIQIEETGRFNNLELIETSDSIVYFDRRWELADGAYFTSPLQTYLDLTTGGKREADAAEQIAGGLLKNKY
jgi:hypothetical protein